MANVSDLRLNRMRIYWANSIFSEADRTFNRDAVSKLRNTGFEVFSPQELAINNSNEEPSPDSIFRTDTAALLQSDVIVACLDAETIDAGVACEIGIAYSSGLPIV